MEKTRNLDDMVSDLLEMRLSGQGEEAAFTDDMKQLIHKIAEKCREISIIEETQDMARDYAKGLTAQQVYVDMLHKIADAPNTIYMRMAALMLIVVIDQKLAEEERNEDSL